MSPDRNPKIDRQTQSPQSGQGEPAPDAIPTVEELSQEALDYYVEGDADKPRAQPKPSILDGEVELPPELQP